MGTFQLDSHRMCTRAHSRSMSPGNGQCSCGSSTKSVWWAVFPTLTRPMVYSFCWAGMVRALRPCSLTVCGHFVISWAWAMCWESCHKSGLGKGISGHLVQYHVGRVGQGHWCQSWKMAAILIFCVTRAFFSKTVTLREYFCQLSCYYTKVNNFYTNHLVAMVAILKNGRHIEFSGGQGLLPKQWPSDSISAKFHVFITK